MSAVKVSALVFDLDGTLVDSGAHYLFTVRSVFAAHGVPCVDGRAYEECTGLSTVDMLHLLGERYGLGDRVGSLVRETARVFLAGLPGRVTGLPGALDLLRQVHEAGFATAVASGSPDPVIAAVLDSCGVSDYVDVRVAVEEAGRGKPAPDVFLRAAAALGVPPRECLVIEDSAPGVAAAHRAGMRCVAVPAPGTDTTSAAFGTAELVLPRGDLSRVREMLNTTGPADGCGAVRTTTQRRMERA